MTAKIGKLTSAQREAFYSASHWEKLLRELIEYDIQIRERHERGEISRLRSMQLRFDVSDRKAFCLNAIVHLKMDPLRINGISFGYMLRGGLNFLYKNIDERRLQDKFKVALENAVTRMLNQMKDKQYDRLRPQYCDVYGPGGTRSRYWYQRVGRVNRGLNFDDIFDVRSKPFNVGTYADAVKKARKVIDDMNNELDKKDKLKKGSL